MSRRVVRHRCPSAANVQTHAKKQGGINSRSGAEFLRSALYDGGRGYMTRHCRRDCNSFRQKEQLNIVGWYAAIFQFGLTNVFRRASIRSGRAGRAEEAPGFLAFVKIASVHSSCCLPCRLVVTSAGNADERFCFIIRLRKNARVTSRHAKRDGSHSKRKLDDVRRDCKSAVARATVQREYAVAPASPEI